MLLVMNNQEFPVMPRKIYIIPYRTDVNKMITYSQWVYIDCT